MNTDLTRRNNRKINMENCPVCGIVNPYTFQRCDCVIPKEEAPVEEVAEEVELVELVEEVKEVEEKAEEADDEEDFEAYLEELPVKELKKLCEKADLGTKGKKADLIARLIE